jgi:hypothetical protein
MSATQSQIRHFGRCYFAALQQKISKILLLGIGRCETDRPRFMSKIISLTKFTKPARERFAVDSLQIQQTELSMTQPMVGWRSQNSGCFLAGLRYTRRGEAGFDGPSE